MNEEELIRYYFDQEGGTHPAYRRRQSICFFIWPGNSLPRLADVIARLPFKEGIPTLSRPLKEKGVCAIGLKSYIKLKKGIAKATESFFPYKATAIIELQI